jgi:hypothetical protein
MVTASTLTKKHFETAAEILSGIGDKKLRKKVVDSFAKWFASENDQFDKALFAQSCGLGGKESSIVERVAARFMPEI